MFWFLERNVNTTQNFVLQQDAAHFPCCRGHCEKYIKLSWIFGHSLKATKVPNTNISAFTLHRKSVCFGVAVSCIATTAAFSGSFSCLVLVKKGLHKCRVITRWKCGAIGTIQVCQPGCVLLKSGKLGGFRKFWSLDFFPHQCQARWYFPGGTAGEERCELWEGQGFLGKADMGPSSFFFLNFQLLSSSSPLSFLLPPFRGESLWPPRPLEKIVLVVNGGQWFLNHRE